MQNEEIGYKDAIKKIALITTCQSIRLIRRVFQELNV